jgi:hypothetical protein
VAGYWSPGYRERKCRKLLALSGRVDLIVAAPDESRTAFQALEGTLPCVWYAHRPSARQLLAALASHYDDFAERRAAVGHASALAEVSRRGVVPAEALGGVLSVYDRSELAHVVADVAAAAQRAGAPEPILVDGLGLASPDWLARARSHIAGMLQERGAAIPLRELAERLSQVVPELRAAADVAAATEALARTTGFTIDREDLFQLLVHTPDDGAGQPAEESRHAGRDPQKRAQPHGSRRRKLNDGAHTVPLPWDDMPG